LEAAGVSQISALCHRIAKARWFENLTVGVIILNAIVLGLETFPTLARDYGEVLHTANGAFLTYFTVEIAIRIVAFGRHPWAFFRSGWNMFDFVIISAAYLPGVRENATFVRLLRVFRLFTLLPDLRILVAGMVRSFRPLGGLALLFAMVFYVYGMLGWILFSDIDPAHWRNIGRALLTMFQLVTVEGWYEVQDAALAAEPWAWVYFVSFVIISAFVLFNMVIGVVINSMEEARAHANNEVEAARRAELAASSDPSTELVKRLDALQEAMTDLRAQLEATPNDKDEATSPATGTSPTSGTGAKTQQAR
jgi:voltage-gated sodium channel